MWILYFSIFTLHNLFICAYPVSTNNEGLTPVEVRDVGSARSQDEQIMNTALIATLLQMPRVIEHLENRILRLISSHDSGASGNPTKPDISSEGKCDDVSLVAKVLEHVSGNFVRKEDLKTSLGEQEKKINFDRDEAIHTGLETFLKKIDPVLSALEKAIVAVQTSLDQRPMNKVGIADTRNENSLPDAYRAKGPGVYYEYKTKEEIVLSNDFGYPSKDKPGFAVLQTVVPWSDSSGGYVTQVAMAGTAMSIRSEVPASTGHWTSWKML